MPIQTAGGKVMTSLVCPDGKRRLFTFEGRTQCEVYLDESQSWLFIVGPWGQVCLPVGEDKNEEGT